MPPVTFFKGDGAATPDATPASYVQGVNLTNTTTLGNVITMTPPDASSYFVVTGLFSKITCGGTATVLSVLADGAGMGVTQNAVAGALNLAWSGPTVFTLLPGQVLAVRLSGDATRTSSVVVVTCGIIRP